MIAALALWIGVLPLDAAPFPKLRWDPGERVTSDVKGQVTRDDAAPSSADGVYGRFEGDLDLGLALGAELTEQGGRGAGRLSLHSFWMAGIYSGLSLGDADSGDSSVFSCGVDLRPAFVPRWSQNMAHGPAFVDLVVDSISLGTGVFWAKREPEDFGDRRGLEVSLGLGLPLLGRAGGPWLETRGMLRWSDSGGSAEPLAVVLLSWHALFLSPWSHSVVD